MFIPAWLSATRAPGLSAASIRTSWPPTNRPKRLHHKKRRPARAAPGSAGVEAPPAQARHVHGRRGVPGAGQEDRQPVRWWEGRVGGWPGLVLRRRGQAHRHGTIAHEAARRQAGCNRREDHRCQEARHQGRRQGAPRRQKIPTTREVSAGGVVYRKNDDGIEVVLASRRTRRGELAWGLAKGGIEEGETEEVAAIREVREETGMTAVIEADLGDTKYIYVWDDVRIRKTRALLLDAARRRRRGRSRRRDGGDPLVPAGASAQAGGVSG